VHQHPAGRFVQGVDREEPLRVLDDVGVAALGVGARREPREYLDGEAAQPLALGDDPVVLAGREQVAAVTAHRGLRIPAVRGVGEREDVEPCGPAAAPPHRARAGIDDLAWGRERPAEVVEQLAQVGPGLRGGRVGPQLPCEPVPGDAAPRERHPREQTLHAWPGELRERSPVEGRRGLAE
jgi:hypothetical protein